MEIETKFAIPSEKIADEIWQSAINGNYAQASDAETLRMLATYYDTSDGILRKNKIALRVRLEGNDCIATIKWSGNAPDCGLFIHYESNVPLDPVCCKDAPDPHIFSDDIDGRKLSEIIGGKELLPLVSTDITRRRVKLKTKDGLAEMSLDSGRLICNEKFTEISEMEIELFEGDVTLINDLTKTIAEKYSLKPENKSKFQRALEMR